jgi:hypothetical protein
VTGAYPGAYLELRRSQLRYLSSPARAQHHHRPSATRAVDAAESSVVEKYAAAGVAKQAGRAPVETRARRGDENTASVVKAGSNSLPPTSQPQGAAIRYAIGELRRSYRLRALPQCMPAEGRQLTHLGLVDGPGGDPYVAAGV